MLFPGMNPYLEDSRLWTGVHARMIVYMCNQLQPQLGTRYVAAIEERVYVEAPEQQRIPDVWVQKHRKGRGRLAVLEADTPIVVKAPELEVREKFVTIMDRYAENQVVAVIELVSPANKEAGPGRDSYKEKQAEVRASKAHLVEIDLLRAGEHVVACPAWLAQRQGPYHYLACVNRAKGLRHEFDLYLRTLRQPLPKVGIPLANKDPAVMLDMQAVLGQTYKDGRYGERIDYKRPCPPPLSPEDEAWVKQVLKGTLRNGSSKKNLKRAKTSH